MTYAYDSRGLLTNVSDDLTGAVVDFEYDDNGRLTSMQRGNGADTYFTWDAASRLVRLRHGTAADL